MIHVELKDKN